MHPKCRRYNTIVVAFPISVVFPFFLMISDFLLFPFRGGYMSRNLTGLSAAQRAAKYDAIKNYVINAYKVMMERGIKGCYIYAHNPELREHLKSMICGD